MVTIVQRLRRLYPLPADGGADAMQPRPRSPGRYDHRPDVQVDRRTLRRILLRQSEMFFGSGVSFDASDGRRTARRPGAPRRAGAAALRGNEGFFCTSGEETGVLACWICLERLKPTLSRIVSPTGNDSL